VERIHARLSTRRYFDFRYVIQVTRIHEDVCGQVIFREIVVKLRSRKIYNISRDEFRQSVHSVKYLRFLKSLQSLGSLKSLQALKSLQSLKSLHSLQSVVSKFSAVSKICTLCSISSLCSLYSL